MNACVTHHLACDCREREFAERILSLEKQLSAALAQSVESDASNVGGAGSSPACRSTHFPAELISQEELDALRQSPRNATVTDIENLCDELVRVRHELKESDESFELRWQASIRAIARWQEIHPSRELIWPDHADLCVWLLEQLAIAEIAARRYESLRRVNVPQFQALFLKNLNGGKSFDELVDELGNHGVQP